MNSELAKKLKDEGFPQRKMWCDDCGYEVCPECKEWRSQDNPSTPSLSELIEACGNNFGSLSKEFDTYDNGEVRYGDIWVARPRVQPRKNYITDYFARTPEEAVAKLWLELNK